MSILKFRVYRVSIPTQLKLESLFPDSKRDTILGIDEDEGKVVRLHDWAVNSTNEGS